MSPDHAAPKSQSLRLHAALTLGFILFVIGGSLLLVNPLKADDEPAKTQGQPAKPALTVTTIHPETMDWPRSLPVTGNIAAWQEVVIGTEIDGYRLTEVLVDVGDNVRRGQLLARVSSDNVAADLAEARATLGEAEAALAEARADADRARNSRDTPALSAQQAKQYLTGEQAALARVEAAKARVKNAQLRLSQTQILAPDDGVISARSAAVGSLAQSSAELLRLIRGSRLEWRAEAPAADMARLSIGGSATLIAPDGTPVTGRIRTIAPTVDSQKLTGIVYVDLPVEATGKPLRAGMFARGELELGHQAALTLPQSAVLMREGFAYVFRVDSAKTVAELKVQIGRRLDNRIEITDGLDTDTTVVESGGGFLTDGDLVRVVAAPPPITPPTPGTAHDATAGGPQPGRLSDRP